MHAVIAVFIYKPWEKGNLETDTLYDQNLRYRYTCTQYYILHTNPYLKVSWSRLSLNVCMASDMTSPTATSVFPSSDVLNTFVKLTQFWAYLGAESASCCRRVYVNAACWASGRSLDRLIKSWWRALRWDWSSEDTCVGGCMGGLLGSN